MIYEITVTEYIQHELKIEADSEAQAIQQVKDCNLRPNFVGVIGIPRLVQTKETIEQIVDQAPSLLELDSRFLDEYINTMRDMSLNRYTDCLRCVFKQPYCRLSMRCKEAATLWLKKNRLEIEPKIVTESTDSTDIKEGEK